MQIMPSRICQPSIFQTKINPACPEGGGVIYNPDLAGYTDRKLLEELKARGFVWSDMKRIQPVKYDSI